MIQPKNETEDSLLSITNNCETLIEQTHKKAEETFEFETTKQRKMYHFKPPISIEGSWMIGLLSLDVYIFFIITQESKNFELHTGYLDDEVYTIN